MQFDLNIHFHLHLGERVTAAIERIAMNMQEMAQALTDAGTAVGEVGDQLTKALGEISTDISDLQSVIAAGAQSTPEVDAALASLQSKIASAKAVAQSLDDVVPDPVAPPAPAPADGGTTTPPDSGAGTP